MATFESIPALLNIAQASARPLLERMIQQRAMAQDIQSRGAAARQQALVAVQQSIDASRSAGTSRASALTQAVESAGSKERAQFGADVETAKSEGSALMESFDQLSDSETTALSEDIQKQLGEISSRLEINQAELEEMYKIGLKRFEEQDTAEFRGPFSFIFGGLISLLWSAFGGDSQDVKDFLGSKGPQADFYFKQTAELGHALSVNRTNIGLAKAKLMESGLGDWIQVQKAGIEGKQDRRKMMLNAHMTLAAEYAKSGMDNWREKADRAFRIFDTWAKGQSDLDMAQVEMHAKELARIDNREQQREYLEGLKEHAAIKAAADIETARIENEGGTADPKAMAEAAGVEGVISSVANSPAVKESFAAQIGDRIGVELSDTQAQELTKLYSGLYTVRQGDSEDTGPNPLDAFAKAIGYENAAGYEAATGENVTAKFVDGLSAHKGAMANAVTGGQVQVSADAQGKFFQGLGAPDQLLVTRGILPPTDPSDPRMEKFKEQQAGLDVEKRKYQDSYDSLIAGESFKRLFGPTAEITDLSGKLRSATTPDDKAKYSDALREAIFSAYSNLEDSPEKAAVMSPETGFSGRRPASYVGAGPGGPGVRVEAPFSLGRAVGQTTIIPGNPLSGAESVQRLHELLKKRLAGR